jgi:cytochrome c-type biogenesis protein CcmH
MASAQAGEVAEALAAWRRLYADTPGDAPWRDALVARIGEAEQQLGLEASDLAGTEALPGPTAEDVEAAGEMSEDEQVAMIRGMVEGLAARLADEPDNLEGWRRLAQSYSVLGDWAEARAAYAHALTLAPEDAALLDGYANAIAGSLSQSEPIPEDAAAEFDRVLEKQPNNDVALYITGLAAAQAGDTARATERWGRLRDLLPEGSAQRAQVQGLIDGLQ